MTRGELARVPGIVPAPRTTVPRGPSGATAMHVLTLGQEIIEGTPSPGGRVSAVQLALFAEPEAPREVVRRKTAGGAAGAAGGFSTGGWVVAPTQHVVALTQSRAPIETTLVGNSTVSKPGVAAPTNSASFESTVAAMAQRELVGHEIGPRRLVPAGTGWTLQLPEPAECSSTLWPATTPVSQHAGPLQDSPATLCSPVGALVRLRRAPTRRKSSVLEELSSPAISQ